MIEDIIPVTHGNMISRTEGAGKNPSDTTQPYVLCVSAIPESS